MGKIQKIKEQRRIEKEEDLLRGKSRKKRGIIIAVCLILLVSAYFSWKFLYPEEAKVAVLETNYGTIKFRLLEELAPKTVENFETLANQGFYDGVKFHRVIKDFMIQTGDPNSKDNDWSDDGFGGPGYFFEDEINSKLLVRGTVAMANNSVEDTNGSQFFIVTAESTPWLDGKHTVFGEVVEGMDVVDAIESVETNENDHPMTDVIMNKVYVEETRI